MIRPPKSHLENCHIVCQTASDTARGSKLITTASLIPSNDVSMQNFEENYAYLYLNLPVVTFNRTVMQKPFTTQRTRTREKLRIWYFKLRLIYSLLE